MVDLDHYNKTYMFLVNLPGAVGKPLWSLSFGGVLVMIYGGPTPSRSRGRYHKQHHACVVVYTTVTEFPQFAFIKLQGSKIHQMARVLLRLECSAILCNRVDGVIAILKFALETW